MKKIYLLMVLFFNISLFATGEIKKIDEVQHDESQFKERTKQMVEHLVGTDSNDNGGNDVSTNDDDRIEITVKKTGIYMISAQGTYHNRAFTIVDVFYSIYTVKNNREIYREKVATNCNDFPDAPMVKVIRSGKVKLFRGDKVELRFGNSGSSTLNKNGFTYAAPKDYILLSKF